MGDSLKRVAALSTVVMLAGCGGTSKLYHQGRTAACLEEQGFVVRYGPRPVDLSVYEEQTGGNRLRLGVLRFYGSSEEADEAAEASPRQFRGTYRNVFAYGWYLPSAAATDCLQPET